MTWLVFVLLAQAAQNPGAAPTQIERGEALFFDSATGCGTCHAMKGKGTAIGPDLKGVARLSPAGLAMAIRSTVTQYVQTVKTKTAGSFPAMPPGPEGTSVKVFDLSKMPPVPHDVARAEISTTPNAGWKHPPSTHGYTDQQIADLIAYVRYAGAGNKSAVDPDDVK
jgi:mono/diheme cytochrome c family protein